MPKLEFFFDCSSPWTYLAFHRLGPLAADAGVDITWRPILVGGVFNEINGSVYEQRANPVRPKQRLRDATDELIARGGFGSPTIFVDRDDMYLGNDRLPLVREALLRPGA